MKTFSLLLTGCNYGHKVWCTKHPLWSMLPAEWGLIKEYCFFPTVEASLSWLSWPWQGYTLLFRYNPRPFFGCIFIPVAQFSPVLYLLQCEYQMLVCGIQESIQPTTTVPNLHRCLWGEHIVPFPLLTKSTTRSWWCSHHAWGLILHSISHVMVVQWKSMKSHSRKIGETGTGPHSLRGLQFTGGRNSPCTYICQSGSFYVN